MHPARSSPFIKNPPGNRAHSVSGGSGTEGKKIISFGVEYRSEIEFVVVARHPKIIRHHFKIICLAIPIQIPNPGKFRPLCNDKLGIGPSNHTEWIVESFGKECPGFRFKITKKDFPTGQADHKLTIRKEGESVDLNIFELGGWGRDIDYRVLRGGSAKYRKGECKIKLNGFH